MSNWETSDGFSLVDKKAQEKYLLVIADFDPAVGKFILSF